MEEDTGRFTGYNPAEFDVNKKICVRGRIIDYKGKPEIIVKNPSQFTFSGGHAAGARAIKTNRSRQRLELPLVWLNKG
jgi:hypothetical protein